MDTPFLMLTEVQMKILLYRWNVYHQEAVFDALTRMGHEVVEDEFKGDRYNEDEQFLPAVIDKIRDTKADIVLTVNYFGVLSDACMQCRIPYVSWTCDSPLIAMYHRSVFNKCNFIFIFDKVQYCYFKSIGVKNVYYLPLAAQDRHPEKLGGSEYEADISFVGSLYEKNSYDGITDKLTPYLRGYFDAAMNAQADIFGENLFDRMLTPDILEQLMEIIDFRQSEDSMSDISLVFNTTFLGFKMAQKERMGCLSMLGRSHEVKLYTDSTMLIDGVRNMGSVGYHTDMPKVFNQSAINLNLTIRNIRSGIPLRAWDIMASGGFLLTNFQAEYMSFFENGRELVWFDSVDDMRKKADYFLEHEEERKEIARRGYECAVKKHSYEMRLRQIINIIESELV